MQRLFACHYNSSPVSIIYSLQSSGVYLYLQYELFPEEIGIVNNQEIGFMDS